MKQWTLVGHWTGGLTYASEKDREHYQAIVEGSGNVVLGHNTPEDQISTSDGIYGAHTRAFNTKCIGVAMAGMLGAKEVPLDFGNHPITEAQFHMFCRLVAAYCQEYSIPVTDKTVLWHSEVQPNLGIRQNAKWDVNHLPWDDSIVGHAMVGDHMRELVSKYLLEEDATLLHLARPEDIPANHPTVKFGDHGSNVTILQTDLHRLRYFAGKIDGHFGALTRGAVLAFQADNDLTTDGVVGPRTWAAMAISEPRPLRDVTMADLAESGTINDTKRSDRAADVTAVGAGVAIINDVKGTVGEVKTTVAETKGVVGELINIWETVQPYWPILLVAVGYLTWRGLNHSKRVRRLTDAQTGGHLGR